MNENETPGDSDNENREQDLQQQLKSALDEMIANIDMSEFDEYDDDDETPSDEKERGKNEGLHDTDEPAFGTAADISKHGNGNVNTSETLGGDYKDKHVGVACALTESMRKDDEKERGKTPNNPPAKPMYGSEESSFLSDTVLFAAKWLIGIIAFFIVSTVALNLFSASMHDLARSHTS